MRKRSLPHAHPLISLGTILISALIIAITFLPGKGITTQAAGGSFTFTAAGDYGQTAHTTATLTYIGKSGASFDLALGDLNYGYPGVSASSWSTYVKSYLPANFPFEIVAGEHDTGDISQLAGDLPNHMGNIAGSYGKEYYFDAPSGAALARFILVSPGVLAGSYKKGGADYNWVSNAIDNARSAGIHWVIVGIHKYCLALGGNACSYQDLLNLLVSKKVDLILSGQKHSYQASKQLALNTTSCTSIQAGSYNANCVVSGSTSLKRGAGSVILILGTGGASLGSLSSSDPEKGYFRTWMGGNGNATWGAGKFTVSGSQINIQFVGTAGGSFKDSFTISG
jgi:hypothetical protein